MLLNKLTEKKYNLAQDLEQKGNFKSALLVYKNLFLRNHIASIVKVADFYLYGYGTEANHNLAFKYYHQAAVLGDADSMATVGISYLGAIGVKRNKEKAFLWLSKSETKDGLKVKTILEEMKIADNKTFEEYLKFKENNKPVEVIELDAESKNEEEKGKKITMIRFSISIALILLSSLLIFTSFINPLIKYNKGISYFENGLYKDAQIVFEEMDGYKDSLIYLEKVYYHIGIDYYETKDYLKALEYLDKANDYNNTSDYIKMSNYYHALILYNKNDLEYALQYFIKSKSYNDSNNYVKNIESLFIKGYKTKDGNMFMGSYPQSLVEDDYLISQLKSKFDRRNPMNKIKIGDFYYIGSYSIDDNYRRYFSNGNEIEKNYLYFYRIEPIKWQPLKRNSTVYITEKLIDSKKFYRESGVERTRDGEEIYPMNYEYSDIRPWLNSEFVNLAFDNENKLKLKDYYVDNSINSSYNTNKYMISNNFYEKVFLPSYKEVFKDSTHSNFNKQAKYSDYSLSQTQNRELWWLRSAYERFINTPAMVNKDGELDRFLVDYTAGVRPVIYL